MEIIENLLFGENVKYLQCSKCKVKLSSLDTIVLHGTVGARTISSALYLCRPDTSVSAHVVVGRDAEIFQLLPFDVKAWHAGKSFHAGRVNLNDCSIGIELDRAGSSWIMPGSYNVWEIDIIRVSGGNILPIRCTRRKKRGGRDTGILLPRGSLRSRRRSVVC